MQEDLAEELFGIVGGRPNDQSILEIDLLDDSAATNLERAGFATCRQKLEHVSDTHGFQSSANSHRVNLSLRCKKVEGLSSLAWNPGQVKLRPATSTQPDYILHSRAFKSYLSRELACLWDWHFSAKSP